MHRRLLPAAVLAAAVVAMPPPAPAQPKGAAASTRLERRSSPCHVPARARVIARSRGSILIRRRPSGRRSACYFRTGRFVALPSDAESVKLTGPYVAYNLNYYDATDSYTYVFVMDLRNE